MEVEYISKYVFCDKNDKTFLEYDSGDTINPDMLPEETRKLFTLALIDFAGALGYSPKEKDLEKYNLNN